MDTEGIALIRIDEDRTAERSSTETGAPYHRENAPDDGTRSDIWYPVAVDISDSDTVQLRVGRQDDHT